MVFKSAAMILMTIFREEKITLYNLHTITFNIYSVSFSDFLYFYFLVRVSVRVRIGVRAWVQAQVHLIIFSTATRLCNITPI